MAAVWITSLTMPPIVSFQVSLNEGTLRPWVEGRSLARNVEFSLISPDAHLEIDVASRVHHL